MSLSLISSNVASVRIDGGVCLRPPLRVYGAISMMCKEKL